MYNNGAVVTKDQFEVWAQTTEKALAANTKLLPPFAYTYTPDANGADGGYYPDNVDPYSKVETYGATQPGAAERCHSTQESENWHVTKPADRGD